MGKMGVPVAPWQLTLSPPSTALSGAHVHMPKCLRVLQVLDRHPGKHASQRVPTRPVPLRAVSIRGRISGKWAKREMLLQRVQAEGGCGEFVVVRPGLTRQGEKRGVRQQHCPLRCSPQEASLQGEREQGATGQRTAAAGPMSAQHDLQLDDPSSSPPVGCGYSWHIFSPLRPSLPPEKYGDKMFLHRLQGYEK